MSFYKPPPGAFSLTSGKVNNGLSSSKDGTTADTAPKPKPTPPSLPPKPQSLVVNNSGQTDTEKSKPLPQAPKPVKVPDPVEPDVTPAPVSTVSQLPAKPPKPPKSKRLSRVLSPNEAIELRDSLVHQHAPPLAERTASLSIKSLPQVPEQPRKQSVSSSSSASAPVSTSSVTPTSPPNEDLQRQIAALKRENEELKTINILLDKREKGFLESQQINKSQLELHKTEIEKLKSIISDYEQQVSSLNTINSHLTEANTNQTRTITALQNEVNQLKSQLTANQQQEQEIERLKHQLTSTQRETQASYEESIKQLQHQVEDQARQLAAEQKKAQLLHQLNEDLEEKLNRERLKSAEQLLEKKQLEQKIEERKQEIKIQQTTVQQPATVLSQPVKTPETVKMVKVVFAYEAKDDDEISLEVGELIRVTSYDDETGWSEGINTKGAAGLFPNNFVLIIHQEEAKPTAPVEPEPSKIVKEDQPVIILVKALFAYNKTEEDELTFEKGDIIEVIQRDDDSGWWFGRLQKNGQEGLFPDNYVKEVK